MSYAKVAELIEMQIEMLSQVNAGCRCPTRRGIL